MKLLPTSPDRIVMTGEFPGFTPRELFDHFTQPELLTKWWPKEAEIEAKVGGKYWLFWPSQNWVMRGQITDILPGNRLGFTWVWDHGAQGYEPLSVLIGFGATEEGSQILIEHGRFGSEDREARGGIVEGWLHFGAQLRALKS